VLDKVRETINKFQMFAKGDLVLLGVSGGPDSVALTHVMNKLREELGLSLHIAHLNHMFRGREAEEDAVFVKNLARKMGISCTVEKIDVPKIAAKEHLSPEEAARKVRYEFLSRVAGTIGAHKIAVGHNADDRAETVLLHLIRGTGPEGLEGIKPKYKSIVRPLLEVRRSEIEKYCFDNGLEFRIDSTNRELIYMRNKVRHHLIPILKEYNSNIVEVLNRTAEIIRSENEYMEGEGRRAYESTVFLEDYDKIELGIEIFLNLHAAIQRRLLRYCYMVLTGKEEGLEFQHIERTRRFISAGAPGKKLELPEGIVVERSYNFFIFRKKEAAEKTEWRCREISVPGRTYIPEIEKHIITKIIPADEVGRDFLSAPDHAAYMDMDKLQFPLYVRPRCEGDSFQPLGLPGKKKVKDILIDAKIPRDRRSKIPVVLDQRGIVWLAGFRIDERVKITDSTRKVLIMELTR